MISTYKKISLKNIHALLMALCLVGTSYGAETNLSGFQALQKKISQKKPIAVAYLGGSITVGAMCHPIKGSGPNGDYDYSSQRAVSWRNLSFKHLQKTYPKNSFSMIHAAIGGTDSELANYRFDDHVLQHKPDLLFIEFVVNDKGRGIATQAKPQGNRSNLRTVSSLIQRARAKYPDIAIIMPLSTMRLNPKTGTISDKGFQLSRQQHIQVANVHKVPYVDLTSACYDEKLPAGVDLKKLFDGPHNPGNAVHPSPHGHRCYAAAINSALDALIKKPRYSFTDQKNTDIKPYPHKPTVTWAKDLKIPNGWQRAKNLDPMPVYQDRATLIASPGAKSLEFDFSGSAISLWCVFKFKKGVPRGKIQVYIDGKHVRDYFSGEQFRTKGAIPIHRFMSIDAQLDPSKKHTLEIRIPKDQKELRFGLYGICVDEGG